MSDKFKLLIVINILCFWTVVIPIMTLTWLIIYWDNIKGDMK